MTKKDKQIIDRAVKEEWRIGDRARLKRLLKKNLEQYRENVELENKIADLKANCDLAIEGRDVKIRELEQEKADLKADNDARKYAMAMSEKVEKQLREENAELKARIDNLKNEFEYSENYGKRVQKERHRLVNENAELREQFTKAKEILQEFVEWANWQGNSKCPSFKSIQDKAEQFLKDSDVEK